MNYKQFRTLICTFIFCVSSISAIAQTTDYSVHANIVYRFTKYIDWPANKKSGDFIIGVVGDSRIYDELVNLTRSKHVGGQPIVIKHYSANARGYNCHVLFVSEDESSALKRIADITSGQPLLLISENTGLIWRGACINILVVNDHLKLEFSKKNIKDRDLDIASELLSLGVVLN